MVGVGQEGMTLPPDLPDARYKISAVQDKSHNEFCLLKTSNLQPVFGPVQVLVVTSHEGATSARTCNPNKPRRGDSV